MGDFGLPAQCAQGLGAVEQADAGEPRLPNGLPGG